ncbi:MAG: hypothetical protein ACRDQA_22200 [Nocardioidaceae bacterium]
MPQQQTVDIALTPDGARDLIIFLIDVHGVLDHLDLHDADHTRTAADAYLHAAGSRHTLPTMIGALDALIRQLTHLTHAAVLPAGPPHSGHPRGGAKTQENSPDRVPPGGAKTQENSGATWGVDTAPQTGHGPSAGVSNRWPAQQAMTIVGRLTSDHLPRGGPVARTGRRPPGGRRG